MFRAISEHFVGYFDNYSTIFFEKRVEARLTHGAEFVLHMQAPYIPIAVDRHPTMLAVAVVRPTRGADLGCA
jgi:hypothetical protein